jgi:hypothetical protein
VAGDVVEDVGLGQVVELRAWTDRDRGREAARGQRLDERARRQEAARRRIDVVGLMARPGAPVKRRVRCA